MAHDDTKWEQPGFASKLDALAVELISAEVQRIFAELDPLKLVEDAGLDLTAEDKATVAHLIDAAVVEMEIDVSGEAEHDHEH
ncbi:MAG TPA: hypothetical protein VGK18_02105 [Propionicimonas sp.]|jgi:hypothetical protein|uniref:hypothetical protein n=1 Tax=Propionicimonas sp. TaxID=1955623 RepID=UPI002F40189B